MSDIDFTLYRQSKGGSSQALNALEISFQVAIYYQLDYDTAAFIRLIALDKFDRNSEDEQVIAEWLCSVVKDYQRKPDEPAEGIPNIEKITNTLIELDLWTGGDYKKTRTNILKYLKKHAEKLIP